MLMNEVAITLNIRSTLMENIIVGNLNDTSIVTVDWSHNKTINAKIL